jgi:hypothetical protein
MERCAANGWKYLISFKEGSSPQLYKECWSLIEESEENRWSERDEKEERRKILFRRGSNPQEGKGGRVFFTVLHLSVPEMSVLFFFPFFSLILSLQSRKKPLS